MEQRKLVLILADISGYTRFMLDNQTAALHGQVVISGLIESILKEVDIPLTLQEIEGDAVFLYAAHPGSDDAWRGVLQEVSRKLERFFAAFMAQLAVITESTPCGCEVCRYSDRLGLKIVVHTGEAVFHAIAGRPQVSGPDVILAHRLLKNGVPGDNYLLVSDAAYRAMSGSLAGTFADHRETYEGFGTVPLHVRTLDGDRLAARDALYCLCPEEIECAVDGYAKTMADPRALLRCAFAQMRSPVRPFTWLEKLKMVAQSLFMPLAVLLYYRRTIPKQVIARGRRRTSWTGRPASEPAFAAKAP